MASHPDLDDDDQPVVRPAPRRARRDTLPTFEELRAQLQRTEQRLSIERRRVALLEERVRQAYALGTWGRRQP